MSRLHGFARGLWWLVFGTRKDLYTIKMHGSLKMLVLMSAKGKSEGAVATVLWAAARIQLPPRKSSPYWIGTASAATTTATSRLRRGQRPSHRLQAPSPTPEAERSFSLLREENLDAAAKRRWSDAYLALTARSAHRERRMVRARRPAGELGLTPVGPADAAPVFRRGGHEPD